MLQLSSDMPPSYTSHTGSRSKRVNSSMMYDRIIPPCTSQAVSMLKLEQQDTVMRNIESHHKKHWRYYKDASKMNTTRNRDRQNLNSESLLSETTRNLLSQDKSILLPDIRERDGSKQRRFHDQSQSILQQEASLKKLKRLRMQDPIRKLLSPTSVSTSHMLI